MRVITLKQPWATLVAEGLKKYEFRSWKYSYRGEILIHAGKGVDKDAMKKFEHQLVYGHKYDRTGYAWKLEVVEKIDDDKAISGKQGIWNI